MSHYERQINPLYVDVGSNELDKAMVVPATNQVHSALEWCTLKA